MSERAEIEFIIPLQRNPMFSGLLQADIEVAVYAWAGKHLQTIEDSFVTSEIVDGSVHCYVDVDSAEEQEVLAALIDLKQRTKQPDAKANIHWQEGFNKDMEIM